MTVVQHASTQKQESRTSSQDSIYSSSGSKASRGRSKTRDSGLKMRSSTTHSKVATRSGYHVFTAFGREFCVEKRWKFVRELGSGAYGSVVLVQDEITAEQIAIKMVTRIFDKPQLSKRALREISLLRHFNNHDNITGLIDMDVSGPDFDEIYLFMEPMEADLYQIIRSGQTLTDAHVRYFMYQILRAVKYLHTAGVMHRDLKPGNLLVNGDCELKICDLGLSRGFDQRRPGEEPQNLTEYVATRWYRAPEIMLSFETYDTAIDMWSVGCIMGELLGGKPLFKGKDYVDQLNQTLLVLGTPKPETIRKIGSSKAKSYVRAFPATKPTPWTTIFPDAHPLAIDLLSKLLAFDPSDRLSVTEALEHPWLASYHYLDDEPQGAKFTRWRELDQIDTTEGFRAALYNEVMEYREEVRKIGAEAAAAIEAEAFAVGLETRNGYHVRGESEVGLESTGVDAHQHLRGVEGSSAGSRDDETMLSSNTPVPFPSSELRTGSPVHDHPADTDTDVPGAIPSATAISRFAADPYRAYARRSSIISHYRADSVSRSPVTSTTYIADGAGTSYVLPARSRVPSSDALGAIAASGSRGSMMMAGTAAAPQPGQVPPQFLRTLSTVSISSLPVAEAARARNGGGSVQHALKDAGGVIGAADAPPSELPSEWGPGRRGSRSGEHNSDASSRGSA